MELCSNRLLTQPITYKNSLGLLYNKDKELVLKLDFNEDKKEKIKFSKSLREDTYSDSKSLVTSIAILKKIKPEIESIITSTAAKNKIESKLFIRFENQEKENSLKKEINDINKEIINLKQKIDIERDSVEKIEKQIDDINLILNINSDINRYTNINKDFLLKQKKLIDEQELLKTNKKDKKNEENSQIKNKIEKLKLTTCKFFDLKNKEAKQLKFKLPDLTKQKQEMIIEIKKLSNILSEFTLKKKELKQNLYIHYLEILKKGTDTRNEGLSWIIKEIFTLKKKVLYSYLPPFLDPLGVSFIFKKANITMQIEKIKKEIVSVKNDILNPTNSKTKNTICKNLNNTQKKLITFQSSFNVDSNKKIESYQDIINKTSPNKKEILCSLPTLTKSNKAINLCDITCSTNELDLSKNKGKGKFLSKNSTTENIFRKKISSKNNSREYGQYSSSFKKNKNILREKILKINNNKLDLSNLNTIPPIIKLNDIKKELNKYNKSESKISLIKYKSFEELMEKYKSLESELATLKKREMQRIFNEYLKNGYYQRYQTEKNVVLSALIGEDNVLPEINKQVKQAKIYFESIRNCTMNKNINNFDGDIPNLNFKIQKLIGK